MASGCILAAPLLFIPYLSMGWLAGLLPLKHHWRRTQSYRIKSFDWWPTAISKLQYQVH